jgi:hypothetical protein
MKLISQNPERYSKVGSSWVISANQDSPNKGVTPLTLPIGVAQSNLKPLIKADGIIVKVNEDYLCSNTTINLIKESNNPHYDIVQNGGVMVKDKEVIVGKTIKIIELNVASLSGIIASRDVANTNAGVTDVIYGPETQLVEGIPQGLIDQINYTLDKVSERPKDEYSIFDFYSLVDYTNNPKAAHYKITPLLVKTQQEDTIFDPTKLRDYLIEVGNKLKLLENDFNLIQDIFYDAKLPNTPISYTEKMQADVDNDTNKLPSVRRNYRDNGEFVDNALATTSNEIKKEIDDLKDQIINEAATQQTSQPVIQKWRLKRKRDGDRNGMGVINNIDKLIFSKGGRKVQPKSIRVIKEGGTFSGYVFKKVVNGKYTLWALQTDANIGVTEYAYQGPGDDVELIP